MSDIQNNQVQEQNVPQSLSETNIQGEAPCDPWDNITSLQRSGTIRVVGPYSQSVREGAELRRSFRYQQANPILPPEALAAMSPEDRAQLEQRRADEFAGN